MTAVFVCWRRPGGERVKWEEGKQTSAKMLLVEVVLCKSNTNRRYRHQQQIHSAAQKKRKNIIVGRPIRP